MSLREKEIARLHEAADTVSDELYEILGKQSKVVASNLFLGYGDKACLSAAGFVYAIGQTGEAALNWLLMEGYVELTDKARASDEERAARQSARDNRNAEQAIAPEKPRGQYL